MLPVVIIGSSQDMFLKHNRLKARVLCNAADFDRIPHFGSDFLNLFATDAFFFSLKGLTITTLAPLNVNSRWSDMILVKYATSSGVVILVK
jgi:hypothetical protein